MLNEVTEPTICGGRVACRPHFLPYMMPMRLLRSCLSSGLLGARLGSELLQGCRPAAAQPLQLTSLLDFKHASTQAQQDVKLIRDFAIIGAAHTSSFCLQCYRYFQQWR